MRISDWSSDVCSSDFVCARLEFPHGQHPPPRLNPDFAPLRVIGWPWEGVPDDPAWREAMAAHPQARPARVVEQDRSGYIVADGAGEGFAVESLPEWQRRSEEHTYELQALMRNSYAVFCLKKKKKENNQIQVENQKEITE